MNYTNDIEIKNRLAIIKQMRSLLSMIGFFIVLIAQAQNDQVEIKVHKLTDHIYMLTGKGGNIGISVGQDGVFMIDDQFAPLTSKILTAIKSISDQPVTYVFNTHWHGDHTGGNLNMANEGAIIVAHENVRKRIRFDQLMKGQKKQGVSEKSLPVITFTEDMMYYFNEEEVFISHIHKAHTDGDALVYFTKNNVLHMGDAYFQGKFPYIDIASGGTIDGYIEGIKKAILLINDDTQVIPGHGKVSNKSELKSYVNMLKILRQRVMDEISLGKSLEQVKVNINLTKGYSSYNGWITEERIRVSIYKSLQK